MLSAKPLKNTQQASHYFFEQDNYYLKDAKELEESTQWSGKGAQTLGLSGQVTPETFRTLLEGKLPNGQQLGKMVDGEISHRPGFDLTFSAPKSVSILAEIGQDSRLQNAHQKSVQIAMDYIEKQCAQARITKNKKTSYENTGNLIIAQFKHDTSRALDPQTHTHCVVMNATLRSDGQWRALASQTPGDFSSEVNGFFEQVLQNERTFGAIYRAQLAYEVAQLGYTVRKTHNDGRFEIAEVPEAVIQHFSKRRQEIETAMAEKGVSGARAASWATLATRLKKQGVDRPTLHQHWKEQVELFEFDAQKIVQQSVEEKSMPVQTTRTLTTSENAIHAVEYAISHLSERNTTLPHAQLFNTAFTHALGEVSPGHIVDAIESAVQNKTLIPLISSEKDAHYTTQTLLNYEQNMLTLLEHNHYTVAPLAPSSGVAHPTLTAEQNHALQVLLESPARYTGLIAPSGTGKSTLLAAIPDKIQQDVIFLTPSSSAQKKWEQAGYKSFTLSRFLKETERDINKKQLSSLSQHVLVLDDAQMVGSQQIQSLMTLTETLDTRLILAGDTRAYLPHQGGSPLAHLEKSGMRTATLQTIERQKQTKTREAIVHTLAGNIEAAFEKIGDRVIPIEKTEDRLSVMAQHYTSLPDEIRRDTLVLTPSATERTFITDKIRADLKAQHKLEATGEFLTIYLPKQLSRTQTTSAQHYAVDDQVRFHKTDRKQGIQAQVYYRVVASDHKQNQITLEDDKKRTITLPLQLNHYQPGDVSVFEPKEIEVCKGDQLRWAQSHPQQGLFNGEILTVSAVSVEKMTLQRQNGSSLNLPLKALLNRHFDHGYVTTPYQSYHQEPHYLIAHQSSKTRQTSQRSFYKQLSQAREMAYLYTDNQADYCEAVKTVTGDRISAVEALLNEKFVHRDDLKEKIAQALPSEEILQQRLKHTAKTPEELAKIAVKFSIDHLSERESVFSQHDVLKSITATNLFSEVAPEHIQKAMEEARQEGILQEGKKFAHWTTTEAIRLETDIITLAKEGKNQHAPIASDENIQPILEKHGLNPGQQQAARLLTQTSDALVLVQGLAGTGKTTMLMAVKDICEQQGYSLQGLAPSHTAVQELRERGITAQTIQSFLWEFSQQKEKNQLPDYSRTLLVIDEASMLSNRIQHDLLQCIQLTHARAGEIGDQRQLASPSAGKPFTLLQKAGIAMATMDEIRRQETPELKEAVKAVLKKDFSAAINALNQQEIPEKFKIGVIALTPMDKREDCGHYLDPLVENFMSRTPEERQRTLIITPRNEDRIEANALLRAALQKEGSIEKKETDIRVLIPRNMTPAECNRADQYAPGDVVRFNTGFRSIGIEKNSYWRIETIDKTHAMVALRNDKGERVGWQPHQYGGNRQGAIEVYKQEDRALSVGEHIRWTRSDKQARLFASDTAEVVSIQDKTALLKLSNGTLKTHDLSKNGEQHFDHAHTATTYNLQGKTGFHIITYENSQLTNLTNQAGFYVAITRAKHSVTVYTDDCSKLIEQLQKKTGEKSSALEFIEYPLVSENQSSQQKTVQEKVESSTPVQSETLDSSKNLDDKIQRFEIKERVESAFGGTFQKENMPSQQKPDSPSPQREMEREL